MEKVKILWSGITGRTGSAAKENALKSDFAKIAAGISRNNNNYYNYDNLNDIEEEFDVIVDFSNANSFDKVLNYALKVKKPLIIGTAKLSDEQINKIDEASNFIPIFKGGNFRFEVKKFIDDVVNYASMTDKDLTLDESFYKSKTVPSETGKQIVKKVFDETGKTMKIESHLIYDEPISEWQVDNLHCKVCGYNDLARDVLTIASLMKNKKPDGLYDLDKLLDEKKIKKL